MAIGDSGSILRSTDNGENFTLVGDVVTGHLTDVAFGNNIFVAVGTQVNVRSTDDGSSWENVQNNSSSLRGVVFITRTSAAGNHGRGICAPKFNLV